MSDHDCNNGIDKELVESLVYEIRSMRKDLRDLLRLTLVGVLIIAGVNVVDLPI